MVFITSRVTDSFVFVTSMVADALMLQNDPRLCGLAKASVVKKRGLERDDGDTENTAQKILESPPVLNV